MPGDSLCYSHLPHLADAGCRIGIIDAGSVNLGDFVYANSRSDIDHQVTICVQHGLAPSMAIFRAFGEACRAYAAGHRKAA